MAEIARAAGLSRQTLYKEFGSRAEFAQALVLREADSFLDSVEEALERNRSDPERALAATFEVYLRAAAENPLVRSIITGDGAGELLALITTQGEPLLERTAGRLGDLLRSGWPRMPEDDAKLLSEFLVRLAISYTALPGGPTRMGADGIARLLGPYIHELATGQSAPRSQRNT